MSLYRAWDASTPPPQAPGGCQIAMGYTGRPGYTPHVWTIPEWQQFAAFRQVPIWVPDLSASPWAEGWAAADAALGLGWAKGRAIIIDMETAGSADASWWAECASGADGAGLVAVAYGSASTVFQLAAAYVGVADWNGDEDLPPGTTVVFHQYQANKPLPTGGTVDLSVCDDWLYQHAGTEPRHG